jgi:PKD repeat protein
VVITVTGVNDPPVAADDAASTVQAIRVTIDVLDNDGDIDDDPLTVYAVGPAGDGTVTNNVNDVTYTSTRSFFGTDVFTYTVSDGEGGFDTATVTVTVDPLDLQADFIYYPDPANILDYDTVVFTDTSTTNGSPIVAWAWDFGDGGTADSQHASHAYPDAGVYAVTLVVTDALGFSDAEVKTGIITVSLRCTELSSVAFEHTPAKPVIRSPVIFTATTAPSSATAPITYTWDFGDGVTTTVTLAVVQHIYPISGTLSITVTAYNPCTLPYDVIAQEDIEVAPIRIFLPLILRNF